MNKPKRMMDNRRFHQSVLDRLGWIDKVKPISLASFISKILAPDEIRRIVETDMGIRVYAHPLRKPMGVEITLRGMYEPDTVKTLKEEIEPGYTVIDMGANEGLFTALSGTLCGETGLVVAIEPQSKLRDLIEINCSINQVKNFKIYSNAFGGEEGIKAKINLQPDMYTEGSSLVFKYKYTIGESAETIEFVSLDRIMSDCHLDFIHLIKVDVEGFEFRVVEQLLPFIEAGKIGKLLLDYHTEILLAQKLNPDDIHKSLDEKGMKIKKILYGDINNLSRRRNYILYEYKP